MESRFETMLRRSPPWPTWGSLVAAEFVVATATAVALMPLGLDLRYRNFVTAVVALMIFVRWLFSRRTRPFGKNEVGILVVFNRVGSPEDQQRTDDTLKSLIRCLETEAATVSLPSPARVVVRHLPPHRKVLAEADVREISDSKRAWFTIWATTITGKANGSRVITMPRVTYIVRHRPLQPDEHRGFRRALELVHIGDNLYRINSDNDAVDIDRTAKHIDTVAKYQLGLALAASGHRLPSIRFLEAVMNVNDPKLFRKQAKHLASWMWVVEYDSAAGKWPDPKSPISDVNEARINALNAYNLNRANPLAINVLMNCSLILGDVQSAERYLQTLLPLLGRTQICMYHFNAAALAIAQGNLPRALLEYKRAKKASNPNTPEVESALVWLYAGSEQRPQYLLGTAFINDQWKDHALAVQDYRTLLAEVSLPASVAEFVRGRLAILQPPADSAGRKSNAPARDE